jgi:hypothetical protein
MTTYQPQMPEVKDFYSKANEILNAIQKHKIESDHSLKVLLGNEEQGLKYIEQFEVEFRTILPVQGRGESRVLYRVKNYRPPEHLQHFKEDTDGKKLRITYWSSDRTKYLAEYLFEVMEEKRIVRNAKRLYELFTRKPHTTKIKYTAKMTRDAFKDSLATMLLHLELLGAHVKPEEFVKGKK